MEDSKDVCIEPMEAARKVEVQEEHSPRTGDCGRNRAREVVEKGKKKSAHKSHGERCKEGSSRERQRSEERRKRKCTVEWAKDQKCVERD